MRSTGVSSGAYQDCTVQSAINCTRNCDQLYSELIVSQILGHTIHNKKKASFPFLPLGQHVLGYIAWLMAIGFTLLLVMHFGIR